MSESTVNEVVFCPDPSVHEYPWGSRATVEAAIPTQCPGLENELVITPGMWLHGYVYEARWQGIRTKEYSRQWNFIPDEIKKQWEEAARWFANRSYPPEPCIPATELRKLIDTASPYNFRIQITALLKKYG